MSIKSLFIIIILGALAYYSGTVYLNYDKGQSTLARLDYAAIDSRSISRRLVENSAATCAAHCHRGSDFCIETCACLHNREVAWSHSQDEFMAIQTGMVDKPGASPELSQTKGSMAIECAKEFVSRNH